MDAFKIIFIRLCCHRKIQTLMSSLGRVHLVRLVQEAPLDRLEPMARRVPLVVLETLVLLEKRSVVTFCDPEVISTGFAAVADLMFI